MAIAEGEWKKKVMLFDTSLQIRVKLNKRRKIGYPPPYRPNEWAKFVQIWHEYISGEYIKGLRGDF